MTHLLCHDSLTALIKDMVELNSHVLPETGKASRLSNL